uniref:CRISPR-associated endonuclease Cas1 n=1 Tax=Strongyloides venezuelensis TaxID=75913 RepID=A0A0K0FN54_STRVS
MISTYRSTAVLTIEDKIILSKIRKRKRQLIRGALVLFSDISRFRESIKEIDEYDYSLISINGVDNGSSFDYTKIEMASKECKEYNGLIYERIFEKRNQIKKELREYNEFCKLLELQSNFNLLATVEFVKKVLKKADCIVGNVFYFQ